MNDFWMDILKQYDQNNEITQHVNAWFLSKYMINTVLLW